MIKFDLQEAELNNSLLVSFPCIHANAHTHAEPNEFWLVFTDRDLVMLEIVPERLDRLTATEFMSTVRSHNVQHTSGTHDGSRC